MVIYNPEDVCNYCRHYVDWKDGKSTCRNKDCSSHLAFPNGRTVGDGMNRAQRRAAKKAGKK